MTPEAIFSLANAIALSGWVVLVLAPRWPRGAGLLSGVVIPGVLGLAYLALAVSHLPGAEGGFGSLAAVAQLFENPWLLLVGWLHYLAFDLFIGSWEVRDAQRQGISYLAVVPCLLLTFLLGPVGLVAYLALRGAMRRRLSLGADA